jgi:hypothetical protein
MDAIETPCCTTDVDCAMVAVQSSDLKNMAGRDKMQLFNGQGYLYFAERNRVHLGRGYLLRLVVKPW